MPGGNNIVSQVNHPNLTEASRAAVYKFKEEYDEYKRKIATYNQDRQQRDKLHQATVRECVSIELLETMILTEEIEDVGSISNLTDEKVEDWYRNVLKTAPLDLGNKVIEVIKKHKHKVDVYDPAAGVQRYVHGVLSDLRHVAGSNFMKDKGQSKNVIEKLAQGLNPKALKTMVLNDKSMWREEDRGKIAFFLKKSKELAVQLQICNDVNKAKTDKENENDSDNHKETGSDSESDEKLNSKANLKRNEKYGKDNRKNNKRKSDYYDHNGNWIAPCLNENCDKKHKIEDCELTPYEEDKKRLLRRHAKKMRAAKDELN